MRRAFITLSSLALFFAAAPQERAEAICRVVNDPEDPPPQIEPDQAVLFLKRKNLEVGDCGAGDAGADASTGDAGVDGGAGADAGTDAGSDADGGAGADAGTSEPTACEVLPNAVTVVVQPRFRISSEGSSFALLMVTPSPPVVTLERPDLFAELAENTKPIVDVEQVYVEDASLGYQCKDPQFRNGDSGGCGTTGHNSGNDFDPGDPPDWDDPETGEVEAIGPYDVARLGAADASELAVALTDLGYEFVQADLDAVSPYLDIGYTVIAVRVRVERAHSGGLQPLALTYPGTEMRLPLGISRQAEPAETSIALYVSADARYDFPGATVTYAQLQSDIMTVLTRSNLIASLDAGPESDPIAVLDPSGQQIRDRVTVTQEILIPSSQCPGGNSDDDDFDLCGCQQSSLRGAGNALLIALSLVSIGLVFRRRRRRSAARLESSSDKDLA